MGVVVARVCYIPEWPCKSQPVVFRSDAIHGHLAEWFHVAHAPAVNVGGGPVGITLSMAPTPVVMSCRGMS